LKKVSEEKDIKIINEQIQQFISSLKLNPIKSESINNNIFIQCPKCNLAVESTLQPTKALKKA